MSSWVSGISGFRLPPCRGLHYLCPYYGPFDETMVTQRAISTTPSYRRYVYHTRIPLSELTLQDH